MMTKMTMLPIELPDVIYVGACFLFATLALMLAVWMFEHMNDD